MKTKKLFFGLFCLGALVLGACSGEKTSSSAAPTSQGSSGSESQQSESSSEAHVHQMVFDSFVWTETPGAYTAKAKYVCSANDGQEELHDANVSLLSTTAPSCEEDGANVWKAVYEGNEGTKTEVLANLGGHIWGSPEWQWQGLNTTATATFTCTRDSSHKHVETASQEGGSITILENVPASCTVDGHTTYRATVQFNGQTYTDDKVENIPATDHPDIDTYGFCNECHEYIGTDLADPDVNVPFNNMFAGTYYYRFLIDEHYQYKKVMNNLSADWFHFYGKVSDTWKSLTISAAKYDFVEIPDDNYVYLVLITTATVTNGYFRIDSQCGHITVDTVGICTNCDEYIGITIDHTQWNTPVEMPAVESDGELFVRAELSDEHITLITDSNWFQAFCGDEEYYLRDNNGNLTSIDVANEFYGLDSTQIKNRNNIKYFFMAKGRPNDGYLYIVCTVDSQEQLNGGDLLTVSTEHARDLNNYGFCVCGDGEYCGTTVTPNYTSGLSLNAGQKAFYRIHNPDNRRIRRTIQSPLQSSDLQFYRRDNEGNMVAISVTNEYAQFDASNDEYFYLVITAGASFINGTFTIFLESE